MKIPEFVPFGGHEVQQPGLDECRIAVLPLPYESSPSYGAGSGAGPYHLLDASTQIEELDEETLQNWTDLKIHTVDPLDIPLDPEQAVMKIQEESDKIFAMGKRLLAIGGDHAVAIGTAKAAAKHFPGMGVLQIDAHLDLREFWNGSRFNHACVMRRLMDDDGVFAVAVGARAICSEELEYVKKNEHPIFFAHQIPLDDDSWMEKAINLLPENVYLSLDLDGLDPSVIPGTGTPEPGGLSYRQVVKLIKTLGENRRVIAADITELAAFPHNRVSEYTAARLAQKICLFCLGH